LAQFGVKQSEHKVLTPRPNYEFICTDVKEVPNDRGQYAYNPAEDDSKMATKWEWEFTGRKGTEAEGVVIKKRTVSYLTTDPRNGWHKHSSAVDPTFDPKVGYASEDDLRKRSIGRPVMLSIKNTTKNVNGEDRTYNNISDLFPSSLEPLSQTEIMALLMGATIVDSHDDIPF
jgi:hypothetical protein